MTVCDVQADRRVKVYFLNSEGKWDDQGTGHVLIMPDDSEFLLTTQSEDATDTEGHQKIFLTTKISRDDIYKQQQDTLIVWNDPWLEQDMALSFQSVSGCLRFWNEIQAIQGKPISSAASDASLPEESSEECKIPDPSISSLGDIHDVVQNPKISRDILASLLLAEGYMDKLFDVLEQCEDVDDTESLHKLFYIFRSLLLLNHPRLFKELISDDYFMRLVGALEYDPELPKKQSHREFLQQIVVFKELIALPEDIKCKVHQAYRIQYLRDTVLPRVLDDAVFASLSNIVTQLQIDIVRSLYRDPGFLKQLFERLDNETDEIRFRDLIIFCQELVIMAKVLPVSLRSDFYMTMCRHGLFNVIGRSLKHPNQKAQLSAVDILWQAAHQETGILRGFMLSEDEKANDSRFLRNVVSALMQSVGDSLKGQIVDVLKLLLDSGSEKDKGGELNEFLFLFYGGAPSIAEILCEPILHPKPGYSSTQYHVLEVLACCMVAHTQRMRRFAMQTNLLPRTLALLTPNTPAHLQCGIIRLIKAVVSLVNENYNAYLVKQNVFAPLVELFLAAGPSRYNLINSAVLSIFEFIRKENVKALIYYVVEQFPGLFQVEVGTDVFQDIRQKYDQHKHREQERQESEGGDETNTESRNTIAPIRDLRDDEDEDYFNSEAVPEPLGELPAGKVLPALKPLSSSEDIDEGSCCLVNPKQDKTSLNFGKLQTRQLKQPPLKVRKLGLGDSEVTSEGCDSAVDSDFDVIQDTAVEPKSE